MKKKIRNYSKIAREVKDYIEKYILSEYDVTLKEEYRAGDGMRYDFCFPYLEQFVAIEADGIQHDKFVPFFHRNKQGFEEAKARDFHKNFNTARMDGYIIRVKDQKNTNVRIFLDEQLKELREIFLKGDIKKNGKK